MGEVVVDDVAVVVDSFCFSEAVVEEEREAVAEVVEVEVLAVVEDGVLFVLLALLALVALVRGSFCSLEDAPFSLGTAIDASDDDACDDLPSSILSVVLVSDDGRDFLNPSRVKALPLRTGKELGCGRPRGGGLDPLPLLLPAPLVPFCPF